MRYKNNYLTFFICLLSAVILRLPAFGQVDLLERKITIVVQNKSLKKVLKKIEDKLHVKFAYSNVEIDAARTLSLDFAEKSFHEVLKKISDNLNLIYELDNDIVILRKRKDIIRAKNNVMVKGKIIDKQGAPVVGASVSMKGTMTTTMALEDGTFGLAVEDYQGILEISSVGYESVAIPLNGQNTIAVVLKSDIKAMDNVVVVGYGIQRKTVVTGAISSVTASGISNQQIRRVEQALQGRTSGLIITSASGAPGSASTVRVRGATSLNDVASNPLYVVDGVVVPGGNIDYLNSGDIESIEVLKDAASAAIYGARSSAGVILITTKKGKEGSIILNYTSYLGIQRPEKKLKLLNATQYATMINEQSANDGGGIKYLIPDSLGQGTDWQSLIFNNNAFIQNHEFSLSGGNEKSTFFASGGYYDQDGIVTTSISAYKRYNIRLNSSHKIRDWLTIGQNLGYSHIKYLDNFNPNTEFNSPLAAAINIDPITKAVITDPVIANAPPYTTRPVVRDENGNPYGISTLVTVQMANPLAYSKTRLGNYEWSDDIIGNAFLAVEPVKGVKLMSNLGAILSYWGRETFLPKFYLTPHLINEEASFERVRKKAINWNFENTVSYVRSFGRHEITMLLGQGAYLDNKSSGLAVTYSGIPASTFEEASMNYNVAADRKTSSGFDGIEHRVNSIFGRIIYGYDDKYLFTGIIRKDGSSRFGPNKKFGYFPSASVAWVATRESFFSQINEINFLKLRASYGITGNDVLGDLRYASTVSVGRNYTLGNDMYLIGYSPDAPANPDLQWEGTRQLNIGLDAILLQHFNLSFDWFKKKTVGILMPVTLPAYVGATGISYANIGHMENRGVELELGYNNNFNKLRLDIKGNVSYLENKVTYLGEGKTFIEDGASRLVSSEFPLTRTAVGHAIGSFYGFKTDGIFQNQAEVDAYTGVNGKIQPNARPGDFKWVDLDKDGQITENDRSFIGDPTPNWSFGIVLNATRGNFDFSLFGQGVAGNQIFQGLRRYDVLPETNWEATVYNRWHGEGTSNTYPRLTSNDANKNLSYPSAFYLESGSYFRIKTFQIGYTLSPELLKRMKFHKIRLYVSSNNLFTFTKYTGYDPEIGGASYGIDRGVYPQAQSFLCGLNFSF